MTEPTFDIFSGQPDKDAIWLEAIGGLSNAREHMEQIAARKPGKYFLFAPTGNSILAQIETFTKRDDSTAAKTASS